MKKRIIPIIALSLIAVIAITTVIFAICNASFKPQISDNYSIQISVTEVNNGNSIYLDESIPEKKAQADKVKQLFNDSFNESALNALFNGRLGYGAELIKKENGITNVNELKKYIEFIYDDETNLPTVMYEQTEVKYKKVIIEITEVETANIDVVKIYLVQLDSSSSSYYFQTYGNFYSLFDYVNDKIVK